jgi:lysozyme
VNPTLRKGLITAAAGGAVAIAGVLSRWHEGRRHEVYFDTGGVPTVCDGITGPDVVRGKTYSDAECDALSAKHLAVAETAVKRQIHGYGDLNEWQQAALIDWTYNFGETKLSGSTMRRKFNAGDVPGGCAELLLWVNGKVHGRMVKLGGLVGRRSDEFDLCTNWGKQ